MTKDSHGRVIDYLRISVTDRCQLRCVYCMPAEGVQSKCHSSILSYEQIQRLVRIAAEEGIKRIRLTGGEPLVRPGIVSLVQMINDTPGIESVALTTNGLLLPKLGPALKEAGLKRVNISLDTLDPLQYEVITRTGHIEDALAGIDAALDLGFHPVKVNSVVVRSLNQDLYSMARMSYDRPLHIRFIEYMPVGETSEDNGTGWTEKDTFPSAELAEYINKLAIEAGHEPMVALDRGDSNAPDGWGPARYFQFPGAQGTVGFISPLSRHFCAECNRLRLTADGKLRPCLFSDEEFNVGEILENGSDDDVRAIIHATLKAKPDEHHYRVGTQRRMSQIGG